MWKNPDIEELEQQLQYLDNFEKNRFKQLTGSPFDCSHWIRTATKILTRLVEASEAPSDS